MKNNIITFPTTNSDELTLEYILNTLDGIVELNDAIIFFTTNDIDSIDPALIRPGRIDYILKMGKTSNKMIRELLEYRYKCVLDNEQLEYIHQIRDGKYSYAELCETCKEYSCIKQLFQSGKLA
jgi:ATP-dependent 26S proteasome regulatory subunit